MTGREQVVQVSSSRVRPYLRVAFAGGTGSANVKYEIMTLFSTCPLLIVCILDAVRIDAVVRLGPDSLAAELVLCVWERARGEVKN